MGHSALVRPSLCLCSSPPTLSSAPVSLAILTPTPTHPVLLPSQFPVWKTKRTMVIMGFVMTTAITYGQDSSKRNPTKKIRPWPHIFWTVPKCNYRASPVAQRAERAQLTRKKYIIRPREKRRKNPGNGNCLVCRFSFWCVCA